jgi:hypothetical protein
VPKGGKRQGAGRPTREQQILRAKQTEEALAKAIDVDAKLFLQSKLNNPASTKYERMRSAELLLRHPPDPVSRPALPELPVKIIAIPREVFLTKEQIDNIEALADAHGVEVQPFEPTPSFATTETETTSRSEPEAFERLPVTDIPYDDKVTRLRPTYDRGRIFADGRRLAAGPRDDDDDAA